MKLPDALAAAQAPDATHVVIAPLGSGESVSAVLARGSRPRVSGDPISQGLSKHEDRPLTSRREFFKSLPRFFLSKLRFVTDKFSQSSNDEKSKSKVARIDIGRCLAWAGSNCQLCYLACPRRDHAIVMSDLKPVIFRAACDGCGMCEIACQTINDLIAIKTVFSGI